MYHTFYLHIIQYTHVQCLHISRVRPSPFLHQYLSATSALPGHLTNRRTGLLLGLCGSYRPRLTSWLASLSNDLAIT